MGDVSDQFHGVVQHDGATAQQGFQVPPGHTLHFTNKGMPYLKK